MKNIIKTIGLITLLFITEACSDVLDVQNLGAFDPQAVWSDPQLTNAYLTDVYARVMPGRWPVVGAGSFSNGGSADETIGTLNDGAVTSTNHDWDAWSGIYADIRKINVLFSEIDNGTLEESFKNEIKAQAHFLRAWSYFLLVRVYGGVPIVKIPQELTDDLFTPRSSTAESFSFIVEDLDEAIRLLGNEKFVSGDRARIGAGAALAFKGRVILYKASPQFNPSNPYDNQFWADALTANETAKNQLEAMGFGLESSYSDIWSTSNEGNAEAIMTAVFSDPDRTNGRREDNVRPLTESKNSTGGDQPIWKFVESYPMGDGFQPGSSPTYTYDVQTYWENRDPRFDANIVGNGFLFELSGKAGRRQYTDAAFAGSEDRFGPTADFNRSGFFPRKGVQPELIQEQVALNSVDWIEIRYTEVLLNFAEAANENGRGTEALAALRAVRERAGIEPGAGNSFGITASSRNEIRDAIYFERYLEFAYEGKRFWDLRRARRLHTELDGTKEQGLLATLKAGLPVDGVPNYTYGPADFDYQIVDFFSGINLNTVPESYYFFPVPISEIQRNENLEQNSDWGGAFDPTL